MTTTAAILARAIFADARAERATLAALRGQSNPNPFRLAQFEALAAEPRRQVSDTPAVRLERHVAKVAGADARAKFAERVRLGLCNA